MGCIGDLEVSVVEGRNLALDAPEAALDTYVLVQVGKQKARTLSKKGTSSPKWLADFKLNVPSEDSCLMVSLLDKGKFLEDEAVVGKASVPIRDVIQIGKAALWVAVSNIDGAEVGEICLILRFQSCAKVSLQNETILKPNSLTSLCHESLTSADEWNAREKHDPSASKGDAKKQLSSEGSPGPAKSGGQNKILLAAGAVLAFVLAAVAVRNHRRKPRYYEVKPGDTLCSIAEAYELSPDDVFEANMNVTDDPDRIYPGDRIYIP